MRYRALDSSGDMVFGNGLGAFLINSPDAVAQAVVTRLMLLYGEWFLDNTDGTNWATGVLGPRTRSTRDAIVRDRILGTPGVTGISRYQGVLGTGAQQGPGQSARTYTITASINTIYGPAFVTVPLGDPVATVGARPADSGVIEAAPSLLDYSFYLDANQLG
jgi:hypothetical protein